MIGKKQWAYGKILFSNDSAGYHIYITMGLNNYCHIVRYNDILIYSSIYHERTVSGQLEHMQGRESFLVYFPPKAHADFGALA